MTIAEIKQIETELNIILPEELVKKYSSSLLDGIEVFPEVAELFFQEARTIVHTNSGLRRKGLWKKSFPNHLLVIGCGGNKEYYMVDLREKPLRVFRVMNNKTWAYDPNDLSKNIVLMLPHEGLDAYIETFPLFHLHMKQEHKRREEQGIPEYKPSGNEINRMLEQMARGTFDKGEWPQIWDEASKNQETD